MLGSALVINNIQRQFPMFWWTPSSLSKHTKPDIEKVASSEEAVEDIRRDITPTTRGGKEAADQQPQHTNSTITITAHRILVPEGLYLAGEERGILEILQHRLREGLSSEGGLASGSSSVTKVDGSKG